MFAAAVALLGCAAALAEPPRGADLATFVVFTSLAVLASVFSAAAWTGGPRGDASPELCPNGYPTMTATWTLPVALLLPPLYPLLARLLVGMAVLAGLLRSARAADGHRTITGHLHDAAALGLSGAAASAVHQTLAPGAGVGAGSADQLAGTFTGVTALITAAAVYLTVDRLLRAHRWVAGREHAVTMTVETCAALVLAVLWAASPVLLAIAVPPVLLLRRGLAHADLLSAARTDAKTHLATMGYWRQVALRETARTRGLGRPLSVLLVDIDHFKQMNDCHGHLNGDTVLLVVADALRAATRPQDLVGRFGGEEFVVLLTEADLDAAAIVAERIRRTIAATPITLPDAQVRVTVSVGVASVTPPRTPAAPTEATTEATTVPPREGGPGRADLRGRGRDARSADVAVVTDLLERADAALYRAKREGRDRVCRAATLAPPVPRNGP